MRIRFCVPRFLLNYCDDDEMELAVAGNTVGEVLQEVKSRYPKLYECICDETGRQRRHINLFVNDLLLVRNKFDTRIETGDVVSVFQSVSGG